MVDSTGGEFLRCYTDALQIIPNDLQHLITNYLHSDIQHQRLLSCCNQIVGSFSETNGLSSEDRFTEISHSLLAMQDICDRRISLVNEMEDLLERQTHALFISGGRLNTANALQTGGLPEESCSHLPDAGTDGSLERRTGETEHQTTSESNCPEDMFPNLEASLLRHVVGTSDNIGSEDTDPDANAVPHCRTSRLSNNRASSSRWPLSRWNEARLYQRKTGLGLVGTHKMTLQPYKNRRSSDQVSLESKSNARHLPKPCSTYTRYSRSQHQRFKGQQHSFSRARYTNRSRTRRLNDHNSSGYSSKRAGFPLYSGNSSKISGYFYPPDKSQAKQVAINESDDDDDESEPRRIGAETFWHFDSGVKHKSFTCKQYDPHEESRNMRDSECGETYYARRKSTTSCSSARLETYDCGDDNDQKVEGTANSRKVMACRAATQRVKSARSGRYVRHHTSHGLTGNSRRRHFGHEPAHNRHRRRLCQLKSRQSRKVVKPVELNTMGQSPRCQHDQPLENVDRLMPSDQSHELGTSLGVSQPDHPQNRSATEIVNRSRHNNQGPPHLPRLRVRSESHFTPSDPPQSYHTSVTRSISPTETKYEPSGSMTTASVGVPTACGSSLSTNHPRSRLRSLGEQKDSTRANDDDSDSMASPDERLYCLCRKVSFGDMIACDNKRCELEWFHFACVDIRVQPKGKWYCPFCRGENSKTRRTDS